MRSRVPHRVAAACRHAMAWLLYGAAPRRPCGLDPSKASLSHGLRPLRRVQRVLAGTHPPRLFAAARSVAAPCGFVSRRLAFCLKVHHRRERVRHNGHWRDYTRLHVRRCCGARDHCDVVRTPPRRAAPIERCSSPGTTHSQACARTLTHRRTRTHVHARACVRLNKPTHAHTHTLAHARAREYARAHASEHGLLARTFQPPWNVASASADKTRVRFPPRADRCMRD